MSETRIPRRLDDVWKLGFIDLDVALPFVLTFGFAALADSFQFGWKSFIGALVGIGASRWYSRKRADKHSAFMLHLAYWFLPALFSPLKRTPPSHIRTMVG